MTNDLLIQLRSYGDVFEATLPETNADSVVTGDAIHALVDSARRLPSNGDGDSLPSDGPQTQVLAPAAVPRRGVWAAIAAVVIAVLIGGVAWLSQGGPDDEVIDDPVVTSIPTPTTVPSTPSTLASNDPSVITSLGTLTWSKVEGSKSSLPSWWFVRDPDSGFIAYEGADSSPSGQDRSLVWRSDDAVTWTSEEIPDFDGYSYVQFEVPSWIDTVGEIDWAMAYTDETSTLYQAKDGSWVPVELPEASTPTPSGIVRTVRPSLPIESGEATVVLAFGFARIPWENYYGTRIGNGDREVGNWPEFDESSQTYRFFDSAGTQLAELRMDVIGDKLVFTDVDTGNVVHEVGGVADYLPELIGPDGSVDESVLNVTGMWVSTDGRDFEYQMTPWSGPTYKPAMIQPLPAGGYAAFVVLERSGGIGSVEVWTSEDGSTWIGRGAPAFLDDVTGVEDLFIWPWTTGLRAEVITPNNGLRGAWVSTDGLTWRPESVLPAETRVYETTFGYVAVSASTFTDTGPKYAFWISVDGETWEVVDGPPGPHDPDGGGYGSAGGAGDVIFLSVGQDSGSRFTWIGRITPP